MKIACLIDTKGKVQYNRVKVLQALMPEHSFDIHIARRGLSLSHKKYDVVYYLLYSLYNKCRVKHPYKICSITSHKCLDNKKNTIRILNRFAKVSANSKFLYNSFKKHHRKMFYIPNGVDVEHFNAKEPNYNPKDIHIGWVGNVDRSTKNYKNIVLPLRKRCPKNVKMHICATFKSKRYKRSSKNMRRFYRKMDFYLVTSDTEGTPNPALEAASCGVPILTTRVGNMPELINEGENGFFVKHINVRSFLKLFNRIGRISPEQYNKMSKHIARNIRADWSWEHRAPVYREFLNVL